MDVDPIIVYQMNDMEIMAYKTGLLWVEQSHKHFPKHKHSNGFPKKGDPRKSTLFRYCYKLVKDSRGILPEEEINLYIIAQLSILKVFQANSPLVDPNCLVGDKAWIRWKIWKKKFDAKQKGQTSKDVGLDKFSNAEIKKDLNKTKQFFLGKFSGEPKEEQIMMAATDIDRWLFLEKISPFYALLSPWAKKYCKFDKVDLQLYRNSVNLQAEKDFKEIFGYESN